MRFINKIPINENEHIIKMWTPLKFEINKDYKFISNSLVFRFFSRILLFIAIPILWIVDKVFLGFKIVGKNNLKNIDSGKITVSNHIHILDCSFSVIAMAPRKLFLLSLKSNFQIPVINWIIKLLNAIPIPDKLDAKKSFLKTIDELLMQKGNLHIYPEGSLWPYCNKIRKFSDGTFKIAAKNNVPIIPIVYTYRKPRGIYFYKKKPCITMNILEPIYPSGNDKESIIKLNNEVYKKMCETLENNKNK